MIRDPNSKHRKIDALIYKCINMHCVALIKYVVNVREMLGLRGHTIDCLAKETRRAGLIRAEYEPE